jgi:hypothetical protein
MVASVSVLRASAGFAVALAFVLSSAMASALPHSPSNAPQGVAKSSCRHARSKDETDWSKYKTIHLLALEMPAEVREARATGARSGVHESYVLDDKEVAALQDSFAKTFRNVFGDSGYTFIDKPQANTLIVKPVLLDMTLGTPGERVSYGGRGRAYAPGGGALTMAAVLADGETGEVLAEVAGHRYPSEVWRTNNAATNLSDARMVFGIWSRALRDKLQPPK